MSNEHHGLSLGKTYTIDPMEDHTASIIFFHGLGDSGAGWLDAMEMLAPALPFAKFILPTAPIMPVTLNFGMSMPAWYDIISLNREGKVDEKGILTSKLVVDEFVEKEIANGIPANRIVVGGFSQGGAISLFGYFFHEEEESAKKILL